MMRKSNKILKNIGNRIYAHSSYRLSLALLYGVQCPSSSEFEMSKYNINDGIITVKTAYIE
jgi:hypothetical protein